MRRPLPSSIRSAALLVAVTLLVTVPTAAIAASLASRSFSDVPAGSTHAPGIGWLVDSSVTSGCGGDRYCPGDEVTRAQMATFLYRLAGNDPAVGPVVDAATVQGVAITDVGAAIADQTCPANQVVAGFRAGGLVCQPVTSLTSPDGSHTVTVRDDEITLTGANGTIVLDGDGIRVRSGSRVLVEGSTDVEVVGPLGVAVHSLGLTALDGSMVMFNGRSGCATRPVARLGDATVNAGATGTIVEGSVTVLAC